MNIAMGVFCGLAVGLDKLLHAAGTMAYPSLFLVPMLGGMIAAFCWRSLQPSVGKIALQLLYATLVGFLGAVIVFREGAICLIIAFPLIYGLALAGGAIGRVWFRTDPSRLRLCVLPLLAFLIAGEPFVRSDSEAQLSDEIVIRASPDRVWKEVTSFPEIPAPANFWLFRLGLPYPIATTKTGDFIGADRRCIFSRDATFVETVAEFLPREKLTFNIVGLPQDPELIGHLTPQRGQFLLRDNGDGTTTLTGTTWYTLHVRPLWYFDAWTRHIFRAVHLRVMEDVRRRAEA